MNHVASLETDIRVWKKTVCCFRNYYFKETRRVKLIEANCILDNDQFLFIFCHSHFYFIYFILVPSTFSGACAYHVYSPCYGSKNKHIDCAYQTMQEPPTKNNPFRPHHLVHLLCFFHKPPLLFPLTPQLVHDSKLLLANVDLHKDAHLHLKIAVLQKIPFHSV